MAIAETVTTTTPSNASTATVSSRDWPLAFRTTGPVFDLNWSAALAVGWVAAIFFATGIASVTAPAAATEIQPSLAIDLAQFGTLGGVLAIAWMGNARHHWTPHIALFLTVTVLIWHTLCTVEGHVAAGSATWLAQSAVFGTMTAVSVVGFAGRHRLTS